MSRKRGYAKKLIERVNSLPDDGEKIGITLGKLCIQHNIPIADVSGFFGISKPTVYKWFVGETLPKQNLVERVEKVIAKLREKSAEKSQPVETPVEDVEPVEATT